MTTTEISRPATPLDEAQWGFILELNHQARQEGWSVVVERYLAGELDLSLLPFEWQRWILSRSVSGLPADQLSRLLETGFQPSEVTLLHAMNPGRPGQGPRAASMQREIIERLQILRSAGVPVDPPVEPLSDRAINHGNLAWRSVVMGMDEVLQYLIDTGVRPPAARDVIHDLMRSPYANAATLNILISEGYQVTDAALREADERNVSSHDPELYRILRDAKE